MTEGIRKLLKSQGTTALKLARDMGICHTYCYAILDGKSIPKTPDRRAEIAERLGVPLAKLAKACGWKVSG